MVTKKCLVFLMLVLTSACVRSMSVAPTPDIDAKINAAIRTVMGSSATPWPTPTAMATATLQSTATLAPTVTLVPTATPGGWCMNRWSISCPTNWSEVLAIWPQIQAAYRLSWISLPQKEPVKVYITGSWWTTACAGGFNGSCPKPLAGYSVIDPKDAQVVWDLAWKGNCHYIIFTMCGNIAWRCNAAPTDALTEPPVSPNTPVPPPPTEPPPTSTPVCPTCPPGGGNTPIPPP